MNLKKIASTIALCAAITLLCVIAGEGKSPSKVAGVSKQSFGKVEGQNVDLYTLTNAHGVEAKITNYGGLVVSFQVPDRTGHLDDVVLGYDKLDDYLKATPYFGAL